MKKIFAIALAVVMVLSIASVASAFVWDKPADQTAETFASRYQIDVVKLVNQTGIIGTNSMIADDNATAVNNAPVYFYIRLTVSGADTTNPDAIQQNAEVNVSFTSLENNDGSTLRNVSAYNISGLGNGTYFLNVGNAGAWFEPLTSDNLDNSVFAKAVIEGRCLDTDTAKVTAKVYSNRPLSPAFKYGDYEIHKKDGKVYFKLIENGHYASFNLGEGDKVLNYTNKDMTHKELNDLFRFLDAGDVEAFEAAMDEGVYMTDTNLRAAFGFAYSQSDSATWAANSTPIILDPIGIPKTGDNASVIGFAMIMVAVVAAAVAVRKVNA